VASAGSRAEWQDRAREAEDLGFDTVVVPDHVVDGLFPPMVALDAMASATSRLRVGTFVVNNDLRHPALVAREAATLDLLTDGRVELGIGAGHAAPEYAEIGVAFERPSRRVARLEEAVGIVRRLFDGHAVTVEGDHHRLRDHRLFPPRRPTLLVGGNGDRVLRLAAREADIVAHRSRQDQSRRAAPRRGVERRPDRRQGCRHFHVLRDPIDALDRAGHRGAPLRRRL
jgi:probable F420-dependent oxidoreductase